jgi:hypothetical protein
MTTQAADTAVRNSTVVAVPIARAFAVFTDEIAVGSRRGWSSGLDRSAAAFPARCQ